MRNDKVTPSTDRPHTRSAAVRLTAAISNLSTSGCAFVTTWVVAVLLAQVVA